jgi:hypothetical protein
MMIKSLSRLYKYYTSEDAENEKKVEEEISNNFAAKRYFLDIDQLSSRHSTRADDVH